MKVDNFKSAVSSQARSLESEAAPSRLQAIFVQGSRLIGRLLGTTRANLDEGECMSADGPSNENPTLPKSSSLMTSRAGASSPIAVVAEASVAGLPVRSPKGHEPLATAEPVIQVSGQLIQPMTLTDVANFYVATLEAAGKKGTARDYTSLFQRRVLDPFPELANRLARDVTSRDITQLLRATLNAKRLSQNRSAHAVHLSPDAAQALPMQREAAKLRSLLLSAFNTVINVQLDPNVPDSDPSLEVPMLSSNPVLPVPTIRGAVRARRRILSSDELAAVLIRLSTIQTPAARVILLSIYLGGQRFAQVMRAKVCDYDHQAGTLMLFDPKGRRATARPHLLPVRGRATELLEASVRQAEARSSKASPWLFSSFGSKPLNAQTVSDLLCVVKAELIAQGYVQSDFDARDLRRTIETHLSRQGVSKEDRAHLLSHGVGGVQDTHYDLYEHFAEKVQGLRLVNEWLEQSMNDLLRHREDRIQVGLPNALKAD